MLTWDISADAIDGALFNGCMVQVVKPCFCRECRPCQASCCLTFAVFPSARGVRHHLVQHLHMQVAAALCSCPRVPGGDCAPSGGWRRRAGHRRAWLHPAALCGAQPACLQILPAAFHVSTFCGQIFSIDALAAFSACGNPSSWLLHMLIFKATFAGTCALLHCVMVYRGCKGVMVYRGSPYPWQA